MFMIAIFLWLFNHHLLSNWWSVFYLVAAPIYCLKFALFDLKSLIAYLANICSIGQYFWYIWLYSAFYTIVQWYFCELSIDERSRYFVGRRYVARYSCIWDMIERIVLLCVLLLAFRFVCLPFVSIKVF